METLRLLLPVVWSVISTVVGLTLYRTTTARLKSKSMAIAGSALIAAACFFGLDRATPTALRVGRDELQLRNVRNILAEGNQHLQVATTACTDTTRNELNCAEELAAVRSIFRRVSDAMESSTTTR
jgi:hypothetical protein